MASRKEYEMLFQLNAQLGSSYSKTFRAAQEEITAMQKEIQSLSKTQSDIAAYQKQQAAVEATRKRLELLQQQYENIQKEIEQTGEFSADLQNKLLAKQQQIDKTSASLNRQTQRLDEMGDALQEAGVDMDDLGQSSARLSTRIEALKRDQEEAAEKAMTFGDKASQAFGAVHEAIVAAGIATALKEIYQYFADCAQASMDFESAITGVAKTTDLTDDELAAMSDAIKEMSTEIPATTEEIAAVAEAAGQLGIQKDSLLDFTEVMTMLGTATNMTADEAATALARFANITGTSADNYDRLGSVIVALGNNFATTESEITAMATRLASAGTLAGLSESEILALSAAMSSVGIEAEAGGTAMTETMNAIETAVAQGNETLTEFARIAGMTSAEFAATWESDAMSALESFISGLGQLDEQGENTVLVLEDLGLTGVRQSNMLKSLALAADQMGGAVSLANEEWDTNTALINEASKRYATTQSQLTMMQNAYKNLKVAIGDAYTPALREAYSVGTDVLNGVAQFIKQNPALVNAITAFAGVLGVVVAALAAYTVGTKVAAAASAMLTAAIPGVNIIMGVAAAVAGVTAAIAALATAADNDAVPSVDELTQAAQGMRDAMDEAGETFENTAAQTVATADVADQYIAKLEEMGDYTQLSNEEQEQYRNTLSLLCQLIPELSDLIDIQNGTIQGGTAALRANTQAWRENAEAQAYQEYMNQLAEQYNEVLVEQAKNSVELTKAQLQIDAAEKKRAAAMARMDELYQDSIDNNCSSSSVCRCAAAAHFYRTASWFLCERLVYAYYNSGTGEQNRNLFQNYNGRYQHMSWNKSTVTDSGVVLLNESLAGHTLTITSAVGGAGTLDDEALKAATDVVDKKQTFNLLGIEDFEQGKRIGIQITNKGILESYILHQIGVRARLEYQEEESLLFILQDDRGIEVPAEVDNPGFLFEVYAVIAVSNNANITISTTSGAIASVEYVVEKISAEIIKHNADKNSHKDIREEIKAVKKMAEEAGESAGNAISNDQIGVPGGVASLGKDGKVPKEQLPTLDYIPTTEKGQAGGVATLGEDGKLVQDVDGGTWDTEPVEAHNGAALAHTNLRVDGNSVAAEDGSATLEEHMRNPLAHQNLVIDGNAGK